jgi:hypothetical protein
MTKTLSSLLILIALLVPAAAQAQTVGPQGVTSDNVEHIGRLPISGDGVGATIVKEQNRMYVTTTQALHVFDITNAESPEEIGAVTLNVQFENEEVPTNGKLLGISSDTYCIVPGPPPTIGSAVTNGCLAIYDVSDPANITLLKTVEGAGDHTSACILDCTYMYGDSGTITDLRDPANAEIVGNWTDVLTEDLESGCHHVREISPGIILGSCQPLLLMSVRPEDGGSPLAPKIIATGANEDGRFIHSSRWPNGGRDKFMLAGGEANAQPQCGEDVSAFMTWDGSQVIDTTAPNKWRFGTKFTILDEVRPENGTYSDGHSPYNALGCSVHWFMEHPTFRNGGLVALAEYENGVRFLEISDQGKITEQGFWLPMGGSTSAPHWHPNGEIVYSIDYTRGIDILRWSGETYVPGNQPDPGATPGTGGKGPDVAPCASAAGFRSVAAKASGRGLAFTVDRRQSRDFTVDLFQQSRGSRVIDNLRVARFANRKGSFKWGGKPAKDRTLTDGFYFARFTMKLEGGGTDSRRVALRRVKGKFRQSRDFYQRTDCPMFSSFKLSSQAFGGSSGAPLGITLRLAQRVESAKIQVKVGKKVVKTFKARTEQDVLQRFKLAASAAGRGKRVSVRAIAQQGTRRLVQTLFATRL